MYTDFIQMIHIFDWHNLGHNILRLFDLLPNFLSPQVERIEIINHKHGICELPQELPNDLRLQKIRKY